MSADDEWSQASVRNLLSRLNYIHNKEPKEDGCTEVEIQILQLFSQMHSLRPLVDSYISNDGAQEQLFKLNGTIPIEFKSKQYNIPVSFWLPLQFPACCPICYVTPYPGMKIRKNHKHVDRQGLIYHPYLNSWEAHVSNLVELVGLLCSTFGENPPLSAEEEEGQKEHEEGQEQKEGIDPNITNWKCSNCTFSNTMDATQCAMCSAIKIMWECSYCSTSNPDSNKTCDQCHQCNVEKYWKCPKCTIINEKTGNSDDPNKCFMCSMDELGDHPNESHEMKIEPKPSPIEAFLSELGFPQYSAALAAEGFETMDDLQGINDTQLKEVIGVTKLAQRIRILRGIRTFFASKSYNAPSIKEEHKGNDEDVGKGHILRNGLVLCVGIAEYDGLDHLGTAKDIALYRALFEDKYHYKVIANDPSQRMNQKDVKQFLRNARKDHLYDFDQDKLNYDVLIVTFGGHGTYDSIICSDGTKYKHKDLRKIFLIDELTEIPKIFLIDACRMDDGQDVEAQKARKTHTASTFSTTLMTSEGNPVYGAQICRFITERLDESYTKNQYTDFRTVYLAAKKRIREATTSDQDLQLCEHDTDIESVIFKPKHEYAPRARGTKAKRYVADSKQTSPVDFMVTFLKNIGMERYYPTFKANGFLDEASLKGVNKETLILLGIENESSQQAIMNEINSYLK